MFKETTGQISGKENIRKDANIDWESLNFKKIKERLLKYFSEDDKKKLKLVKDEGRGENGFHREYGDEDGRVVLVEEKYSHSDEHESSRGFLHKEYALAKNGNIETIKYSLDGVSENDGVINGNDRVGELKFKYAGGKVVKARAKEISAGEDDGKDPHSFKHGKVIDFVVEYDEKGKVANIYAEEKLFNSSKTKKELIYEKERDKEIAFNKMSASEIIEKHLIHF